MISYRTPRRPAALLAGLLALALAGCASGPRPPAVAPAAAEPASQEDVGRAIDMLNRGEVADARRLLAKVLKAQPNNPLAADLTRQIDGDPVALLGQKSFPYAVREGDTLSTLAGRFLGNPTTFYLLGRYNNLAFPVTLQPGQMLRIPGEPKVVAKPRPAPADKARPLPAPPKPAAAPAPAKAAANGPARAATLRAAALEQLNRGAIDRAIALLQQADRASPGNPLIQRDLTRAIRIGRAVQARR